MTKNTPRSAEELIRAFAQLMLDYHVSNVNAIEGIDGGQGGATTRGPATPKQASFLSDLETSDAPWKGLSGEGPGINLKPSAELYAKMEWLGKNLPGGMSMRGMLLAATEEYVAKMIAQHYR